MGTFGERFKQLRLEKNLTQDKIAEIFYLNKSSISRYESGKQIPEAPMLQKFSNFFNVSLDYMMGLSDTKTYVEADHIKVSPQISDNISKSTSTNNMTLHSLYEHNRLIELEKLITDFPEGIELLKKLKYELTDEQLKHILPTLNMMIDTINITGKSLSQQDIDKVKQYNQKNIKNNNL